MQLPINPTDNDRLKTTKVTRMLDELGVLPAAPSQRPNFLRSRRTAAVLIDRALGNLAPDPSARKHCCNNASDFAGTLNDKFATALGTVHGSGSGDGAFVADLIESNFRDDVYKINGSAVALDDVWESNAAWNGGWGSPTIAPGIGYFKSLDNSSSTLQQDLNAPVLKSGLFGSTIDIADGFTVLIEGSCVYSGYSLDDDNVIKSLSATLGLAMVYIDFGGTFWDMEGGPDFAQQRNSGNDLPPDPDEFEANFSDQSVAFIQDTQTPLDPSPAIFRLAFTFESNRAVFSLNGRAVQESAAVLDANAPDTIALIHNLSVQLFSVQSAIEYVGFGTKVANDADLMTLTAP